MSVTQDLEEVLRTVDVPTAIGAIYIAVKYTTHLRVYLDAIATAQKYHTVDLAPETDIVLAIRLIKALEKHADTSVRNLSEEMKRDWINRLAQLSFALTEKQHPYNETRGKELLAQLRAG